MRKFTNVAKKMLFNEEGAALVEYALLVGLIAMACVVAIGALGDAIAGLFQDIADAIGGIELPPPPTP